MSAHKPQEYLFTSEDVARGPPGYISPLNVNFSPDDKYLTYLFPDDRGVRKVFAVDLQKPNEPHFKLFDPSATVEVTGTLSLQEQLRRERMRLFTHGISSYEWSEKTAAKLHEGTASSEQKMLIPLNGKILLYDASISTVISEQCQVVFDPNDSSMQIDGQSIGDAVDPHLSPDGKSVAFVANDDLFVLHLPSSANLLDRSRGSESSSSAGVGTGTGADSGVLHRLTTNGAHPGVTCGLADFLAQEEMDRYRGFWWSPDSRSIVYAEADESQVPEYNIQHLGKADPTHSESHRYPFAGKINPTVKLAVVSVPPPSTTTTDSTANTTTTAVDSEKTHVWLDLVGPDDPAYTTVESLCPTTSTSTSTTAAAEADVDFDGAKMQNQKQTIDYYVCRVGWWPDGSVMVQVENRAQTVLQLLRIDPSTGQRSILVQETSEVWINLHDMLHCFPKDWALSGSGAAEGDFYFLWASERSGFSQLYLYHYHAASNTTSCLSGNTPIGGGGEFVVESIDAVDEDAHVLYFTGNREHPTEKHLYCASYLPATDNNTNTTTNNTNHTNNSSSGKAVRITSLPGWHNCTVHAKLGLVADAFSSVTCPPVFMLYKLTASGSEFLGQQSQQQQLSAASLLQEVQQMADSSALDARLKRQPAMREALIPPSLHVIRSDDNQVSLYCYLYLPPHLMFLPDNAGQEQRDLRLPAVVSVYGGPHVQRVYNNWLATADLRAQRLAQLGFAVIKCDNRGSYRRGLSFEGALRWDMGNIEVADQRTAVQYFAKEGIIDANQVGMFGWSYGGYMSAMSVCRAPETFKCAVAGAPVTSWDGYDTHYTERYMGTPQGNAEGYRNSSVMQHARTMTSNNKLMLVHGLIDENVHFRHTARLINTLIEQRRQYELMLFPCERHSPHKLQDKIYMEDLMVQFFSKYLLQAQQQQQQKRQQDSSNCNTGVTEGTASSGNTAIATATKITARI